MKRKFFDAEAPMSTDDMAQVPMFSDRIGRVMCGHCPSRTFLPPKVPAGWVEEEREGGVGVSGPFDRRFDYWCPDAVKELGLCVR